MKCLEIGICLLLWTLTYDDGWCRKAHTKANVPRGHPWTMVLSYLFVLGQETNRQASMNTRYEGPSLTSLMLGRHHLC